MLKRIASNIEALFRWLAVDPETLEIKTAIDTHGGVIVVKGRAGEAGRFIGVGGTVIKAIQTIASVASHGRLVVELVNPINPKGPPIPDNQWPLPDKIAPIVGTVKTLVTAVDPEARVRSVGVDNAWIITVMAKSWSPEMDEMVKAFNRVLDAIARSRRSAIKVILEVGDAVLQQSDTGRAAGS
jgi:predicted RNA-binding protein YlqC (UPF0109 family)